LAEPRLAWTGLDSPGRTWDAQGGLAWACPGKMDTRLDCLVSTFFRVRRKEFLVSRVRKSRCCWDIRSADLSHWFSTRQGCAQERKLNFLPWRYRVLKTALRLRPRRALSSAPGQSGHFRLKALLAQKICPAPMDESFSFSMRDICVVALQIAQGTGNSRRCGAVGGCRIFPGNQREQN